MKLLKIEDMSMFFSGLKAIQELNMELEDGEIRGLIGPNGAGKTTLFNVISGVYRPTRGSILFKDKRISDLKPHQTSKLGIVRTFQEITLFKNFNVLKNVMVGCHLHSKYNFWGALLNSKTTQLNESNNQKKAENILDFMGLMQYRDELAVNLPNGHQRALGVSIALAAEPKLLMLDEPVTGMNNEETAGMMKLIEKIRNRGITILIIEHDMKVVMGLCDKITVLNFGTKIAEGSPEDIQANQDVLEAYLGSE